MQLSAAHSHSVSHLAYNPPPSPLSLLPPSLSPSLPPFLSTHSTASVSVVSPAVGLVRKLVGVLEAIEKLPVYIHEAAGQVLNLQVYTVLYIVHVYSDIYTYTVDMETEPSEI